MADVPNMKHKEGHHPISRFTKENDGVVGAVRETRSSFSVRLSTCPISLVVRHAWAGQRIQATIFSKSTRIIPWVMRVPQDRARESARE